MASCAEGDGKRAGGGRLGGQAGGATLSHGQSSGNCKCQQRWTSSKAWTCTLSQRQLQPGGIRKSEDRCGPRERRRSCAAAAGAPLVGAAGGDGGCHKCLLHVAPHAKALLRAALHADDHPCRLGAAQIGRGCTGGRSLGPPAPGGLASLRHGRGGRGWRGGRSVEAGNRRGGLCCGGPLLWSAEGGASRRWLGPIHPRAVPDRLRAAQPPDHCARFIVQVIRLTLPGLGASSASR